MLALRGRGGQISTLSQRKEKRIGMKSLFFHPLLDHNTNQVEPGTVPSLAGSHSGSLKYVYLEYSDMSGNAWRVSQVSRRLAKESRGWDSNL